MKLAFAATIVLAVAIFDSAAGAATTVTEHDENRAALLRGVSASDEEPEQAHGRMLGESPNGSLCTSHYDCLSGWCEISPQEGINDGLCYDYVSASDEEPPNGYPCTSHDDCVSGQCDISPQEGINDGVCYNPFEVDFGTVEIVRDQRCFSYFGRTDDIPVTQQCDWAGAEGAEDAKAPCCRDEDGKDACENFHGTVCVTNSLPSCTSTLSCAGAGVHNTGDVLRIEPGSCLSPYSCYSMVDSTVASGSCNGMSACWYANGIEVGEQSCNEFKACQHASAPVIMGSSCNAKSACEEAKAVPTRTDVCNAPGSCYQATSTSIEGSTMCNACCECAGSCPVNC